MLKIQSKVSGVPDFYTSPYLVLKTVPIGFAPGPQEVIREDECKTFLDDDYVKLDTKWRSSIALHVFGIGIGALICLVLMLSMCCEWSSNFYRMSGCFWILICTMFTGLTFLALDSKLCKDNPVLEEFGIQDLYEDNCKIASGSIILIIGIVGLFLAGVTTCVIKGNDVPRKEKEKKKEDEKDAEEPTQDPEQPEPEPEPEPAPEPEPEPETEPNKVEEPNTEPVEEPEPQDDEPQVTEETYFDETAKEGGQEFNKSSKITSSGRVITD
jgi:hypothetical protein